MGTSGVVVDDAQVTAGANGSVSVRGTGGNTAGVRWLGCRYRFIGAAAATWRSPQ
jgi:hypothetical protein